MAYTAIPDTDIDSESPLTTSLVTLLRDNPIGIANGDSGAPAIQNAALAGIPWAAAQIGTGAVTETKLGTGAVTNAKLGASAVTQGKLSTSSGDVSQALGTGMTRYTLPGGAYGFYPRLRSNLSGKNATILLADLTSSGFLDTSNRCEVSINTTGETGTGGFAYVNQTYITASPPYDLGDGEVPMFAFALLNPAGEIVGAYAALDPPWAYNGPTDIAPQLYVGGAPMRRVMLPEAYAGRDLADRRAAAIERTHRSLRINPGDRLVETLIPVDHTWKNADMDLIPHPFAGFEPGLTPVMLDTQSPVIARLAELHAAGESACELLNDWLIVDNIPANTRAPAGVQAMRCRWRNIRRAS